MDPGRVTGFATALFGEPLFLRTASPEVAEILAYYFNLPFLEPAAGPAEGVDLLSLPETDTPTESDPGSLSRLLRRTVQGLAEALNPRFLFLHGCALVARGGAIVCCGTGGSGKTTLAMASEALGYPVMGEDIVAVDRRTRLVHPLAMPYRPRPYTLELLRGWGLLADSQAFSVRPGGDSGPAPLSRIHLAGTREMPALAVLLNCTFRPGGGDPSLLARQLTSILGGVPLHRSADFRIRKDLDRKKLEMGLEGWVASGERGGFSDLFECRPESVP